MALSGRGTEGFAGQLQLTTAYIGTTALPRFVAH